MAAPLILGAGPAGCAAAITLARSGIRPVLVDRDETPGDPLCGGFLSWRTVQQLRALGLEPAALGGHRVDKLRLYGNGRMAELALPQPACGLSRHRLDTELRRVAAAHGVDFAFDTITELEPGIARGRNRAWRAESIFLATGKHDLRGAKRPRISADPALGLRLRLPPTAARQQLIGGGIELHMFRGGYAGIVLQEGGSANICLALRKSALARAGNSRVNLIAELAEIFPDFAARLGHDWREAQINTIGSVPYGWIGRNTLHGMFRLGDQAAVIPSLAGEGIGLALASGDFAARHWLERGAAAAPAYQHDFANAATGPIRLARLARHLAESPLGAGLVRTVAMLAPAIVSAIAQATRIEAAPALAQVRGPA